MRERVASLPAASPDIGRSPGPASRFSSKGPVLFFNGSTFADIGRQLAAALFADLAAARRREAVSAIAHYIAGVLDREAMMEIVEGLCDSADFKPGEVVKTLRGTTRGVILRVLKDGRVAWQPDGSQTELIGLPESLLRTGLKDDAV